MRLPYLRTRGLTLIEVLVALTIFALLGVLTWRATDHLSTARQQIGAELERWRMISLAVHRIGTELQQIMPSDDALTFDPAAVAKAGMQTSRDGAAAGSVSYLTPVGRKGRPARSGFVQVDRRLEWWLWDDLAATTTPEKITLLEDVDAVRWRFLAGERWIDAWPTASGTPSALPAAIALELELPDAGTLVRVFALR